MKIAISDEVFYKVIHMNEFTDIDNFWMDALNLEEQNFAPPREYGRELEIFYALLERAMREGYIRLWFEGAYLPGIIEDQLEWLRMDMSQNDDAGIYDNPSCWFEDRGYTTIWKHPDGSWQPENPGSTPRFWIDNQYMKLDEAKPILDEHRKKRLRP